MQQAETMQPIEQNMRSSGRAVAAVAAIVIQCAFIYFLAMGLGAVPKSLIEPSAVMINVPPDVVEEPPPPPAQAVDPVLREAQIPIVPPPEIVVETQNPMPAEVVTEPVSKAPVAVSESVSEQIRVLQNTEPPYPNTSILKQEEGTVYVRITVSTQGRVVSAQVEKSSGFAALDEAALKAIRTWRFAAAKRAGVSVESSAVVPVIFQLKNRQGSKRS